MTTELPWTEISVVRSIGQLLGQSRALASVLRCVFLLRRWRLLAWRLWTAPYNGVVVLLTAIVLVQSRAWRIRFPSGEPATAESLDRRRSRRRAGIEPPFPPAVMIGEPDARPLLRTGHRLAAVYWALGLAGACGLLDLLRMDDGAGALARSATGGGVHQSFPAMSDGGFSNGGPAGDGGNWCGPSQLITYRLTGELRLSDTTAGLGDGLWALPGTAVRDGVRAPTQPPATAVLRLHHDGVHVDLVSLSLPHNIHQRTSVMALQTDVYTNLVHSVAWTECGAARGTLSGTPPMLRWGACLTPATYGTKKYGVGDQSSGPGCAANWGDWGNIWCSGAACGWGELESGDNMVTRPPVWNQPLAPFEFIAADLSSFSTSFFQVPTVQRSALSRIRFTSATEVSRSVEVTPACVCP